MFDKFIEKILTNDDKFIIYYSDWCRYSTDAIKLLKSQQQSFKGYKIDKIRGGLDRLIASFTNNKDQIHFNTTHGTRPIVFYKGKFVGGLAELTVLLDK